MADIEYAVEEYVATITLNRPERKNAFTTAMVDAWADALVAASGDEQVRAVVVTGADGAFCSGVDLAEFKGAVRAPAEEKRFLTDHVHRVARAVEALDKPLIAAVDGAAVGAGMDMALMCDYRVGSRTARLAEAYIRIGLVPGDGGAWLLPRIVGRRGRCGCCGPGSSSTRRRRCRWASWTRSPTTAWPGPGNSRPRSRRSRRWRCG